jgi:sulfur carrier protein
MQLIVNGEEMVVEGVHSVADLVRHLDLDPRKLAIELDLEIVPRSLYETTALHTLCRLEIVHFVGGGQ